MKKIILILFLMVMFVRPGAANSIPPGKDFIVKGFHLDLRIQVITMDALKDFAKKLSKAGINTLIMEWEGTFPYEKHPLIPNRYAYTKDEIKSFIKYCDGLGIDVIPLQQSFGHVEYILRNYRYANMREDQKDFSQVCPMETALNKALFTDLYTELASVHPSKFIHIGGDETYLLGHCPRCSRKAAEVGKSKLYIDHIKMLCDIVIKLGKRPVLWADIALKYPEAIKSLPKETVFIDWNYGWGLDKFGDHEKLMESGYEIWGAPSLRSHPDNYFLTQWEKHFNNIHDFVPMARKSGYKGIIMTSWSTSGIYSTVWESATDFSDLYAMRHVYPITGFNILLEAYLESLKSELPLNINQFIEQYCLDNYGFNKEQSTMFWKALTMTPYEVINGKVKAPVAISTKELLDSVQLSAKMFRELKPSKKMKEFEHYKLMADIRVQFVTFKDIEEQMNSDSFTSSEIPKVLVRLKQLMVNFDSLDQRFNTLNKGYFNPSEIKEENNLRNIKIRSVYERVSRQK